MLAGYQNTKITHNDVTDDRNTFLIISKDYIDCFILGEFHLTTCMFKFINGEGQLCLLPPSSLNKG